MDKVNTLKITNPIPSQPSKINTDKRLAPRSCCKKLVISIVMINNDISIVYLLNSLFIHQYVF